jgi:pilus assembly protein CpaF
MRPDRIIVGEVRGGEALDMLSAMNTGHEGSMTTVHCNGPRDALSRLETMVLMAGYDLPVKAIREQICSALNLIMHLDRMPDGRRIVTSVTELQGMEGGGPNSRTTGELAATGLRPKFLDKLTEEGIEVPAKAFRSSAPAPTASVSRLRHTRVPSASDLASAERSR